MRWIFEDKSDSEEGVCWAHSTDEGSGHTPKTAHTTLRWIFEDRFASEEGVCWVRSTDEEADIHPKTARTTMRRIFEDRSASEEGVCRAHSTDERNGYTPKQHVRKREERAICQQSDPFFRPRRSDHCNPPSTSI